MAAPLNHSLPPGSPNRAAAPCRWSPGKQPLAVALWQMELTVAVPETDWEPTGARKRPGLPL